MENKLESVKLILASRQKFYMVTKFNKMKSSTCEGGLQNLWSNLFVPMTIHVKINSKFSKNLNISSREPRFRQIWAVFRPF